MRVIAVVSTMAPRQRSFDALVAWMERGVLEAGFGGAAVPLTETFALSQCRCGYGLIARRAFRRGNTLAIVPVSRLITSRGVLEENFPGAGMMDKQLGAAMAERARMAEFIAMQRNAKGASRWAAYIELLPEQHVDLPRHWPQEVFSNHLCGSFFPDFVRFRALQVQRSFDVLQRARSGGGCWVGASDGLPVWEDFSWAWDVVTTRAAWVTVEEGMPPGPVLFPLLDIANHSDTPNMSLRFDSSAKALRCEATRDIRPGEGLFSSYFDTAAMNSWTALERWGFASPSFRSRAVTVRSSPQESVVSFLLARVLGRRALPAPALLGPPTI